MKARRRQKKSLEGDPGTALITGSAGGLGMAFARKLADIGYNLILVDRRGDQLKAVADEIRDHYKVKTDIIKADLTVPADILRTEKRISKSKDLTMLINNAGFGIKDGYIETTDIQQQIDMISVHNIASTRFVAAAVPQMIARQRGYIINVASILAFFPLPGNALYCGTKAYLINFTETLHLELSEKGIGVQVLCPGFVYTGFHDAMDVDMAGWEKYPWMNAEDVVDESLEALWRGKVVFIPGRKTRRFLFGIRALPRRLLYSMAIKQERKARESG
jgi:short-subunit dehydrogenase